MEYKGYEIDETPNEWGYYEAYSLTDCDAPMEFEKSIERLKVDIDDLKSQQDSQDFPLFDENEFMFI